MCGDGMGVSAELIAFEMGNVKTPGIRKAQPLVIFEPTGVVCSGIHTCWTAAPGHACSFSPVRDLPLQIPLFPC